MRILLITALASASLLAGCDEYDSRPGYAGPPPREYAAYDYDRPDPAYNGYYADRYYREDRHRREQRLTENDRIYAGQDGRYYCRHSDGTTGLIVGGITGGVLGAALAPGRSSALGALLGAAGGAAVGNSIDRNKVRCR